MGNQATATALARIELAKVESKLAAARGLLATMEMTDAERERFCGYIERLEAKAVQLEAALGAGDLRGDEDEMDTRFGSVEATLRTMDERLAKLVEQIHLLDTRQQRIEDRFALLERDFARMTSSPSYNRTYLATTAVVLLVMLVLLVVITWRIL